MRPENLCTYSVFKCQFIEISRCQFLCPPAPCSDIGSIGETFVCFVVEEGLTLASLFDSVGVGITGAMTVIDTDCLDTATGSFVKFQKVLSMLQSPGTVVEGQPTPLTGAVLRMSGVGIVIRNTDGVRVWPAPGSLPTIYAPTNGHDIYAALAPDLVARFRMSPNN